MAEPITTTYLTVFCHRQWGNFEQFLDYGHIRYHLLLSYNQTPHFYYCAENICLRALYDAFTTEDITRQHTCARSCINLFMPTLQRDYVARQHMGPSSDELIDIYTATNSPSVKLQAKTTDTQLGMEFSTHSSELTYPTTRPVKNTYPHLPRFLRGDVSLHEVLPRDIFRVSIAGREYWLKTVYHYYDEASFSRELESLHLAPVHSTVCRLIGVMVDCADDTKIDGVVLAAREGARQLSEVEVCSAFTAEKWKSQIEGAVALLHSCGVVWGWAVEDNVFVDGFGNASVVDFSGGPGQISAEGDLEGLQQIFRFIDGIVRRDSYNEEEEEDSETVVGVL